MKFLTALLSVVFFLLLASSAIGQTLDGPVIIRASGDGSFEYVMTMTYPASGALFGGYTIYDIDNIAEGTTFIDGFCMSEVSGGTITEFTVSGHLEDLTLPGTCKFEWFGCDPNFVLQQDTLILTPTVANELATWSLIKASYR